MDLQELSNLFRQYGVHKPYCQKEKVTAQNCPCGFIQILLSLPINTNQACGTLSIENPQEPRPEYKVILETGIDI